MVRGVEANALNGTDYQNLMHSPLKVMSTHKTEEDGHCCPSSRKNHRCCEMHKAGRSDFSLIL